MCSAAHGKIDTLDFLVFIVSLSHTNTLLMPSPASIDGRGVNDTHERRALKTKEQRDPQR